MSESTSQDTIIDVCRADELAPGQKRIVEAGGRKVGVFNAAGELYAIEDRCSHDDGPLVEGDWEPEDAVVVCPRHGSRFDIRTGRPLTLPAFEPVETFPVHVENGTVKVEVPN